MARKPPTEIDEQLLRRIGDKPEGIGIDELLRLLDGEVSRRTLQRRLSVLVDAGRLATEGAGRSTCYLLPKSGDAEEDYVRLSPSGADVRRLVRRPLTERTPVSYNREFLDQYRPNESSYLTPGTIAILTRIGATPDADRPAGTYARHILNRLLVDLSWASSRLGNTYSLLETQRLIEFGEAAEGKDASETQMILNHKAAIEFIVDQGDELAFNRQTILNLHALLADNLLTRSERRWPITTNRRRHSGVGLSPSRSTAVDRGMFSANSGYSGCDPQPLRASIFCDGTFAVLATIRGCQQTRVAAGCQHPLCSAEPIATFVH
jgi:hypothetical protein